MSGSSWDGFPVAALDRIWRPPSGGRRVMNAKAYVWLRDGSGGARAQLQRIVDQAPQVMVKVSGRQRDADHVSAHFEYIARHGKLEVETDDGEHLTDVEALRERAQEWRDEDGSVRANAVTSISMVLSMPAGTPADKVLAAARAFARLEFEGQHHYVLALHDDTDHPHVHLTVAAAHLEPGGPRYNPRKADLYRMRETFAQELRERGVDADATARRARGITRRHDNIALQKLKERYDARGETPETVEMARRSGADYAQGRSGLFPWERAAVVKQKQVRDAYARVAARLAESPDPADRALGGRLERFVEAMPPALSQRLNWTLAHAERVKREQGDQAAARLGVFSPRAGGDEAARSDEQGEGGSRPPRQTRPTRQPGDKKPKPPPERSR